MPGHHPEKDTVPGGFDVNYDFVSADAPGWLLLVSGHRQENARDFPAPILREPHPYTPERPLNSPKEVYMLPNITINNPDSFKSVANDMIHCGTHLLYVGVHSQMLFISSDLWPNEVHSVATAWGLQWNRTWELLALRKRCLPPEHGKQIFPDRCE